MATLFRRFPTRDDVVGAVFADKMAAYLAAAEEAPVRCVMLHSQPSPGADAGVAGV